MVHIYIDAEFDAVKINGKYCQMVVSLGAILKKDAQEAAFYSLVRPKSFRRLTSVIRKMAHLGDSDIRNANSFPGVLRQFMQWLQPCMESFSCRMYSFGPDDRRTLLQEYARHHCDPPLFEGIFNLQKQISARVTCRDVLVSAILSLDGLKTTYTIEGAMEHNALTGASDPMRIHQTSLLQDPNRKAIREIVERKLAKQRRVARRQQGKLLRTMKKRFLQYTVLKCPVRLCPEIVEQLRLWEEHDRNFRINVQEDSILLDGRELPREQTKISMWADIERIPSITLSFTQGENVIEKKYLFIYRNVTMVENILKRTLQHGSG